jgi:hypothetical protein
MRSNPTLQINLVGADVRRRDCSASLPRPLQASADVRNPEGCRVVAAIVALLFLLLGVSGGIAQNTNATSKVRGFNVPVYYPPPFESQMSTLLSGAEAEPDAEGRVLITQGRIQYFAKSGKLDIIVEAPQCILNTVSQEVSSDGPLRIRSADGKLDLEGQGFLWQQTNSNLIVSNRVRTVISSSPNKVYRP